MRTVGLSLFRPICTHHAFLFAIGFFAVTLTIGCGSKSASVQAPSNLAYPRAQIHATVGQAISPDLPTVSGTVTSYAVTPALPAGLSLDASTGAISGTPTTAAAQSSYTVTAANSGGSTTSSVQIDVKIASPSSLAYSVSTIIATIGVAITPDTPAVSGTVSSYAVSPALPAGLAIDSTSGIISGAPTATSPQTSYTVTATNSSGSTTATIAITVNLPPPASLAYPQTSITGIAGDSIASDVPNLSQASLSFSVVPSLPAGLHLDSATGVLYGTPSTSAAQQEYTVTASNSGGSVSSVVKLAVLPAPTVLLELGHGSQVTGVLKAANHTLSIDYDNHWVLWDSTTKAMIADGQAGPSFVLWGGILVSTHQIAIAGTTMAIFVPNGIEIRSAVDGHLMAVAVSPGLGLQSSLNSAGHLAWWRLASDGSYVAVGSDTALSIFDLSGKLLVSKAGAYTESKPFAAPGAIRIGKGPAGQNVIETLSVADGSSTIGAAFSGDFNSWFLDGNRFLTNLSNTVWVYSKDSVQEALMALPSVENLTGQGNWVWTFERATTGYPVNVYSIGMNSPSFTFAAGASDQNYAMGSGCVIGVLNHSGVHIIDLAGNTPALADYVSPMKAYSTYQGPGECDQALGCPFTATSASDWALAFSNGALLDGPSLTATPEYFAFGQANSIAGAVQSVAVAVGSGEILVLDPAQRTQIANVPFSARTLMLSSDGSVLAASGAAKDFLYDSNQLLNIYSLPSASVTHSFSYPNSSNNLLLEFALASGGQTIAQASEVYSSGNPSTYTNLVSDLSGATTYWTDHMNSSQTQASVDLPQLYLALSPNGTALTEYSSMNTTNLIQNGSLKSAVPGLSVGWLDDNRVLVNQYNISSSATYTGANIYSPQGAPLASAPLPELKYVLPVTADAVYAPSKNAIYSLSSGQSIWSGRYPESNIFNVPVGTISGSLVVYQSGHRVVEETH